MLGTALSRPAASTRTRTQIGLSPRVAWEESEKGKGNRERLPLNSGGQSRNRTKDTRIFNPLLYQLS